MAGLQRHKIDLEEGSSVGRDFDGVNLCVNMLQEKLCPSTALRREDSEGLDG